jgi:eukaryotic-like serine/threonine-protein kinase
MGIVWQARDERLERMVAIKQLVLQPGLSEQEADEARRRALREARIAARLQHPNAVTVFDVAVHEGEPCLVMEFLPSRSLSSVLAERGTLPLEEAAGICAQVASALIAAHAAGIVHRDIKPANILLTDSGTAKITDFGISRAVGDVTVTQTGISAGTPAYLAPEVARGHDPSPSADVFSLGATLYNAVEGRPPFGTSQNPLALLHAVATGKVPPPRQAGRLTVLLTGLVCAEPEERPTMKEAAEALSEVAAGRSAGWTPTTKPVQPVAEATSYDLLPQLGPPPPDQGPGSRRGLVVVMIVLAIGGLFIVLANSGALNSEATLATTTTYRTEATTAQNKLPVNTTNATQSSTTTTTTTTTTSAPPPTSVTNDPSGGPIDFNQAGTLVISFYDAGNGPQPGGWAQLSADIQRLFGDQQAYQQYWAGFQQVVANNAFNLTSNPDGSVNVPVDVTFTTKDNKTTNQHKVLRVLRSNGQLLIDGDPRQS